MLRHSQRREYASSTQAMKLWNILQEHLKNGTYELTYGATDPVVIGQMAKYQQVCETRHLVELNRELMYSKDSLRLRRRLRHNSRHGTRHRPR
jgi:isocitrate lyase